MPALSESIAALPPLQRRMAEAWLTRFEENWHDQKLRECMRALPAQSTLRRPLLLAMIERDLAHHWDQGRHDGVESYLKDFPELGGPEELPIELIAAEYNVRQKHGAADLSDFAERFPSRIDDLYVLLKPGLFNGNSVPAAPKADNAADQRRLQLLRTPAEAESSDPGAVDPLQERRLKLLRSSAGDVPLNGTPMPEDAISPDVMNDANGDVDLFLPPEQPRTEPTKPLHVSPAQTVWLDIETAREKRAAANAAPRRDGGTPALIGRYQISRRLGSSGLGSIFEALDTDLDRRVALKVPTFAGPDSEADRASFHREARAAAGLSHPLLCPVLDVGQVDGVDYLAMPYVEGDPLLEMMKQRPTWPARQAVDLTFKLATALDAAHRRGVVHRDLKPSNVLITQGETPVVVGFGQATRPDHSQQTVNAVYVAPEQAAGSGALVGPRADIYSLGAILYQVLTGQAPPAPGHRLQFPGDVDADLQTTCRKALAADPDDRYTTMRDFAQDLSALRQKLRPSEQSSRLSLSRSSQRLPAVSGKTPPPTNAVAKMQELRKLSNSAIPAMAPPRPGTMAKPKPWKFIILGGVGLLVLLTTVVALSTGKRAEENPWPNYVPPNTAPETKKDSDVKPSESPKDLLRAVESGTAAEREEAANKLKLRRDAEAAEELAQFIVQSEWSEQTTREPRDAALTALLSVDPLRVPDTLKRAAQKSEDSRVRGWTYREIVRRIDTDNQSVLLPVFLAGLRDTNPDNRRVVAEQFKQLPAQVVRDPSVVAALYNRVCDDVWGEVNNSPPNSFIHNPRADGGKNAAVDALEEVAPERVASALNVAARSSNLDVRKWAERKKKARDE